MMTFRTKSLSQAVLGIAGLLISLSAAPLRADTISITNSDFNLPTLANGAFKDASNTTLQGWTFAGNGGYFNPIGNTTAYPDDNLASFATTHGDGMAYSNSAVISQTLAATILANTSYTLTLMVGDRGDKFGNSPTLSYGLYDAANGTILGGVTGQSEISAFGSSATGTFITVTATFNSSTLPAGVNIGDALAIKMSASSEQYDFDNVQLTTSPTAQQNAATVPLPSAAYAGLSLLGIFGAARLWRDRRQTVRI